MKKGEIMINFKEIQVIVRVYIENLYSNKLENQEKIEKFLEI
jgi:hypothetical protein